MLMLIIGVALWWGAHLFKRVAPGRRAEMGNRGRGLVTGVLFLSIGMMIYGFRSTYGPVWWDRSAATTGINNLLVLVAFYLFAADGMKTRVTKWVRHPQLTAFSLWAFAHLLVNGDLASVILFGGLLLWALAEIVILNRETTWTPPAGPFPAKKEIMAAVGAVVVMLIVGLIHGWLGYWPFGG